MKSIITILIIFTFNFLAVGQTSFTIQNSMISIEGTSNVHDWVSEVTQVKATGELLIDKQELKAIHKVKIEIPVKGIKSSKGSIMDGKTYKALQWEAFPNIVYELKEVVALDHNKEGYTVNTVGNLTIAGTTKPINLEVKGKILANGSIQFTGAKQILMTNFNIDPPTALLGTLKTGDEVTVKFDLTLTANKGTNVSLK